MAGFFHRFKDTKLRETFGILLLILFFILINILSVRHLSLTYDEDNHYRYGEQLLRFDPTRFNESTMPFSALNALPKRVGEKIPLAQISFLLQKYASARMVTVLASLVTGLLCFYWSKRLYGSLAGLLTLVLYFFEPNILAHSRLVTTDVFAVSVTLLTMFTLWQFANHRDLKHGIFFSVALGVSQLAKYTSIFLYPLSIILFFIHDSSWLWQQLRSRSWKQLRAYLFRFLLYCSFAILVSLIILNAGFLFKNSFLPLSQFDFRSELFQEIQKTIISVMDVRIPVPQDFIQGMDVVVYKERTAFDGRASFYLLGNLNNTGFLGYYMIAYIFKTPIALLILFTIALVTYIRHRSSTDFLTNELFLIGPIVYFVIYFNIFNRFPKGIRHFMVIIPFVLIFTSSMISNWNLKVRWKRYLVIGLLIFMVVSVMSYFPHFIPYFNEFVPNRNLSYKILADSNLDWGQGQWYLERYLEENPEAIYLPEAPTSGTIVIDPNRLLGILGDEEEYRWLRENYEPTGTIAYEYLIYEIP